MGEWISWWLFFFCSVRNSNSNCIPWVEVRSLTFLSRALEVREKVPNTYEGRYETIHNGGKRMISSKNTHSKYKMTTMGGETIM